MRTCALSTTACSAVVESKRALLGCNQLLAATITLLYLNPDPLVYCSICSWLDWTGLDGMGWIDRLNGMDMDGRDESIYRSQAGESDRALDVLETMERNGVQPDEVTYGTLMKACEGEGAFSIMRSLMDEMDQRGVWACEWVGGGGCARVRAFFWQRPPSPAGQRHKGVSISVSVSVSAGEKRKKGPCS